MSKLVILSAQAAFHPDTWSGKQLGDKSNSTRWLGYNITVALTRHRSNPWIKEVIKKYKDTGKTPEITIQGIMCDGDSDFSTSMATTSVPLSAASRLVQCR